MNRPVKPKFDPYSSFKNDSYRLVALMSRDLRLVLVALVIGIGTHQAPALARWFAGS